MIPDLSNGLWSSRKGAHPLGALDPALEAIEEGSDRKGAPDPNEHDHGHGRGAHATRSWGGPVHGPPPPPSPPPTSGASINAESVVKAFAWLGPLVAGVAIAAVTFSSLKNDQVHLEERVVALETAWQRDLERAKGDLSREIARTESSLREELKRLLQDVNLQITQASAANQNLTTALSQRVTEQASQMAAERTWVRDFIDKRYNVHMDDVRERTRIIEIRQSTYENELARFYRELENLQNEFRGRYPNNSDLAPRPRPQGGQRPMATPRRGLKPGTDSALVLTRIPGLPEMFDASFLPLAFIRLP